MAFEKARAAGCEDVAQQFEETVSGSYAVMNVKAHEAYRLVYDENELRGTYYLTADTHIPPPRPPEGVDWNRFRELVDTALFTDVVKPHIRFAALAQTARGLTAYGPCTLVCRTSMIEHRASVFEKNSCQFFVDRGGITFGATTVEIPLGVRSTWADRSKLSLAKLVDRLVGKTKSDFAEILMTRGQTTADDDYVEVHIWGPLTLRSLVGISIDEDAPGATPGILADIRDRLVKRGMLLKEEIP